MSEREADPLGVTIGAREIYDQVVGLRGDVRSLVESREAVDETLADHEQRLRSVERWKYSVPVAAIGALTSTVVTIYKAVGGA